MKLDPETPLTGVAWIPSNRIAKLRRLGIATLADLVRHYPHRHEDRSRFQPFPDGESAEPVLVMGVIVQTGFLPYGGWRKGYEAIIEEPGGLGSRITCRWFNMPFLSKALAKGLSLIAYGRTKQRGRRTIMDFPEFEILNENEGDEAIHLGRIVPIHPAGEGISARQLRQWIHRALESSDLGKTVFLSPALSQLQANEKAAILSDIHFPIDSDAFEKSRQNLVHEEFFGMQLLIASRRARASASGGTSKAPPGKLLAAFLQALPFRPTGSQQRAIDEIRNDLATPHRMNRLLQGDVGSGKTLVAVAAALLTIEAGEEVVLMAPTQILAEQHFATISRLLDPLGIRVGLRTAARSIKADAMPLFDAPGDSPVASFLIGTHALLFKQEEMSTPGLVIIDEQHKFGVLQRARLVAMSDHADVLIMSATPIPRTLAQTAYGDLDVTVLTEMPQGRGKIITGIRSAAKIPEATTFLRAQLDAGRQIYIVYPLIEESDKLALKAAQDEFTRWKPLLAPHNCGLLHGRLKADEKESVMRSFRDGDVRALIATTVVEVGIDVPNATVMLIENAERFGLAQLHQLRGRIGRGSHTSYCILIPSKEDADTMERLRILEKSSDGFKIAEADLALRGAGDLLGTEQAGLPPLRLGDLVRDAMVMDEAHRQARAILEADPALDNPVNQHLRSWIDSRQSAFEALLG